LAHDTRESSVYIEPALYAPTSDSFVTKVPADFGAPATPSMLTPWTELAHAAVSPPALHNTVGNEEPCVPSYDE
jgi:hypothetical protein